MANWRNLKISMLLTGSELVDGRLQDANSLFTARYLFDHGQQLFRTLICDDDSDEIVDSLRILADRSDVIITSGGLGPTSGDKTREAIAQFLGAELVSDQISLEKIKRFFRERNRVYESNNDKQALIPKTARVIENDYGTAACFSAPFVSCNGKKGLIFALPGVPRELQKLLPEKVIPSILEYFSITGLKEQSPRLYPVRIFGLGESTIAARVLESAPASQIRISYRATFPEVQVLFKAEHSVPANLLEETAVNAVRTIGSDFVFSQGEDLSLVDVLHRLLTEKSITIALAESCTGGMLGQLLTRMAGSSRYFVGSFVTYSNFLKQQILGVSESDIEHAGAVSSEVALSMARAARSKSSADIGLSVTGIAGPYGGSEEKPTGTCYLGLCDKNGTLSVRIFSPASRERVRQYACHAVLDLLRRRLLDLEISSPLFNDLRFSK